VSMSRGWGSLLGGRWGQWAVDGGYPRRPVAQRKGGAGGVVIGGSGCYAGGGKSAIEPGRS
jgi:hypothetical protein